MPAYVVHSEGPIRVREVNRPDLPDWEAGQLPVFPERPSLPRPPEGWEPPTLPPREEWPPLPPMPERPPWLGMPELPWVPVPPDPEIEPPPVFPPILPELPGLPDLSGKTLVLARIYVSRHVNYLRWIVIDHDEAKSKLQKLKDWVKSRLPAGGIGGTPPQRPGP